jgi:hypothetical protein
VPSAVARKKAVAETQGLSDMLDGQGADGDEYGRTQSGANRGWWKPGEVRGQKITPEPPEERIAARIPRT